MSTPGTFRRRAHRQAYSQYAGSNSIPRARAPLKSADQDSNPPQAGAQVVKEVRRADVRALDQLQDGPGRRWLVGDHLRFARGAFLRQGACVQQAAHEQIQRVIAAPVF